MDVQKLLKEKEEMEYHLVQFNNFGSTFVKGERLSIVLNFLKRNTDFFKFIVEINHGGFYIHNLADF